MVGESLTQPACPGTGVRQHHRLQLDSVERMPEITCGRLMVREIPSLDTRCSKKDNWKCPRLYLTGLSFILSVRCCNGIASGNVLWPVF